MPPQLLANENTLTTARQHWSVLAPALFVGVALIVAAVVLIGIALPATVAGHATGSIKTLVLLALVVVVILAVGVRFLQWRAATYTLTNKRIIVSRGVVSKVTESIALDRIQDTVVRKPIAERMIHAGDVEIESAGRDGVEILRRIPNPDGFYNALLQAIETHRMGTPAPPITPGFSAPPPPPPGGV